MIRFTPQYTIPRLTYLALAWDVTTVASIAAPSPRGDAWYCMWVAAGG